MICLGIISFFFLLRILNFLVLCIDVFHQFWKIPSHYLFKYFFLHHCLSLLLLELQLHCSTGLTYADLINIFLKFLLPLCFSWDIPIDSLEFTYPLPAMSISTVKTIERIFHYKYFFLFQNFLIVLFSPEIFFGSF